MVTPVEMATNFEKGFCFNCDEKFIEEHCCQPPQFISFLVEVHDNDTMPYTILGYITMVLESWTISNEV